MLGGHDYNVVSSGKHLTGNDFLFQHENKAWIGNTQCNIIGHVLASPELIAYNIYDTDI